MSSISEEKPEPSVWSPSDDRVLCEANEWWRKAMEAQNEAKKEREYDLPEGSRSLDPS